MDIFTTLLNFIFAHLTWVLAILMLLPVIKNAWKWANDPKYTWKYSAQVLGQFVVFVFLFTVGTWALLDTIVPLMQARLEGSPVTQAAVQTVANTIATGQNILGGGSNGQQLVQEIQPIQQLPQGNLVQDLASYAAPVQSSVTAGLQGLLPQPVQQQVAPAQQQAAPAQNTIWNAPAQNNVQAAVQGPVVKPAGWLPPNQQGPVIPQQAPQRQMAAQGATQTVWGNGSTNIWAQPTSTPPTKPGGGPTVHIVSRGDTMFKIAAKYGVRMDDLCNLNRAVVAGNCSLLRSGMELMIPAK